MDESMLLRLVMVSGLVSGSDLAKFYSAGGGGLDGSQTLEEFLASRGVDAQHLNVLKRAYVETTDFGSTLLESMYLRRADEARIREVRKALNVCETEQLLAIKRGEPPLPIGEMLVERGMLSRQDLDGIIRQQGMISRIEHYTSEVRRRPDAIERLGLGGVRSRLLGKGTAVAAAIGLLLVLLANLWWAGAFRSQPDPFALAGGPEEHARNVRAGYGNMFAELRRGQTANAEHYRGQLDGYIERLDQAGVVLNDAEVARIRGVLPKLDLTRIGEIAPGDRLRLSQQELEKRLVRNP